MTDETQHPDPTDFHGGDVDEEGNPLELGGPDKEPGEEHPEVNPPDAEGSDDDEEDDEPPDTADTHIAEPKR